MIRSGTPLGLVVAHIFTRHFEEKWVMNSSDCPTVRLRYVDDTFTLFRNKDTAIRFLHYLNSRHGIIQFTIEFEHNQDISFLDEFICDMHARIRTVKYVVSSDIDDSNELS